MAEQYKVLIQSTDAPARELDVSRGAGAQGRALRIKAQPGQKLQLHALGQAQQSLENQPDTLQVPKQVKLKRVGSDLQIMLDDFGEADVVVEGYYDCHLDALQAQAPGAQAGEDEQFSLQSLPFVSAASVLSEGVASSCVMMAAPGASPLVVAGVGSMQVAVVADDMRSAQPTKPPADDPYKIILAEANGEAADATPDSDPSAAQYKAIGADIGDAADFRHSNNLALLNDIVGAQEVSGVDTVTEINNLARIANAVQTLAVGGTPNPMLTLEDFSRIGITGVSFGNIDRVLQALAQTQDSGDEVNSLAKLQDLVSANSPYLEIVSSVTLGVVYQGVTVVAYDDQGHEMGRSTLAADNIEHTITIDAQGWGQYHGAVLLKVLDANGDAQNYSDEASGADKNLTTTLRAASVADASNKNYQTLDVKGDGRLTVDITPLTEMAVRLAERAGGETFVDKAPVIAAVKSSNMTIATAFGLGDLDITDAAVVVNTSDFHAEQALTPSERYGVVLAELSGIDDLEDGNLENTIQALFDSIKGEGTQAKLTVFGEALLEEGAIKILENLGHANATADTEANRNLFTSIASSHKDDAVSAVEDATHIYQKRTNHANVSTAKIRAISDAYEAIFAEAMGGAADASSLDPTAAQYAEIGVIGADTADVVAFLGDVIRYKNTNHIDTVAEVQALLDTINVVRHATSTGTEPSVSQLIALGITGVTPDNHTQVQRVIAEAVSQAHVFNSVADLQTLVTQGVTQYNEALQAIENYALGQATAPQLSDYIVLGLTTVTSDNLTSVNSAIKAHPNVDVQSSATKLQDVATTYNTLLEEVSNASSTNSADKVELTAAQYEVLGVNLGQAQTQSETLALLNSVMSEQATTRVDTVDKVDVLVQLVNTIQEIAAETASSTPLPTVDEFAQLGLKDVRDDNLQALIELISAQPNDGSATNTVEKLQTLVNDINDAPVLSAGAALSFVDALEDSANPVGAVGMRVSAFTGDISDADVAALRGVAITSINTRGVLHFSLDSGDTWQIADAVSPEHALLLSNSPSTRIYFQLGTDDFGVLNSALTFRAWDQTVGNVGGYGDTSTTGGTSAYSELQRDLRLKVAAVNDAPTLLVTPVTNVEFSEGGTDLQSLQGAAVVLFSSVHVNLGGTGNFENNQTIKSFTVTAAGLRDGVDEQLQIDGKWVSLIDAETGTTSANGVTYQVSVDGPNATVSVQSAGGLSGEQTESLVINLSYRNTNTDHPNISGVRSFQITSLTDSEAATSVLSGSAAQVMVRGVNDRPTLVQTASPSLTFTENGAAIAVLANDFKINDTDDGNFTKASITITDHSADGTDKLIFNDTHTIGGSFDVATGVLTLQALAGQASQADFEAALKSVKYQSTSENPTQLFALGGTPDNTRNLQVSVTDAGSGTGVDLKTSPTLSVDIHITGVEDKPVITLNADANLLHADLPAWGTTPYAATDLKQVDSELHISDADDTQLWGTYIRIANWSWSQDAFVLDLQDPITHVVRPVLFDVRGAADLEGALASLTALFAANNLGQFPYGNGSTPFTGIRYASQGSHYGYAPLDSAYLQNDGTNHYAVTQSFLELRFGYAITLDSNQKMIAATGSISDFAKNLESLRLASTQPQGARPVEFTVTDVKKDAGALVMSEIDNFAAQAGITKDEYIFRNFTGSGSAGTREIASAYSENAAPVITLDNSHVLTWTEGRAEIYLSKIVSITDPDQLTPGLSDRIQHATITLGNALATDELVFNSHGLNLSPASAAIYNAADHTWTLTLEGVDSLQNYRDAINSITWRNSSSNPTASGTRSTRTVSVSITDNFDNLSAQSQKTATKEFTIDVVAVNDAPVVLSLRSLDTNAQEQTAFDLTNLFSVTDVDVGGGILTLTLTAAHSSEDRLRIDVGNTGATRVSGGDGSSHVAVVSGTLLQLQALLAGRDLAVLQYQNAADTPLSQTSISVMASDGVNNSATVSEQLMVDRINDAPVLNNTDLALRNVSMAEPRGSMGISVTDLIGGIRDVDGASARLGIAITSVNSRGLLYYSTDSGTTWTRADELSNAKALLLKADTSNRVYFSANPSSGANVFDAVNLDDAIAFHAWDQTSGTNASYADASTTGGSTAFSVATDTVRLHLPAAPSFGEFADHMGDIRSPLVSGGYTDDTKPTFTGRADVGSTVKLYNNDVLLGSTAVDALGVWTFTPSAALSLGAHTITSTATDALGNTGASSAVITFTVDTTAATAVADTLVGTEDASTLVGHVDINDTGKDGTETYVLVGSATATYGSLVLDRNGSYQYTRNTSDLNAITTAVTDSFNYRVVDAAGNKSASTLTITLAPVNDAPVLTHTTLGLGGIGLLRPVGLVGTTVASLMGGIVDLDGSNVAKGLAIVEASTEGTLYYSTDAGITWTAATSLSETHALLLKSESRSRVYFQPSSGSVSNVADAITFRAWDETMGTEASYVSIDTSGGVTGFSTATDRVALHLPAAPQISTITDDIGTVLGSVPFGGATDDTKPKFSGTAEVGSTVKLYNNGVLMAQVAASSPLGAWAFTSGVDLTPGAHIITAAATDGQGNTGPACSPVTITIDTVAPKAVVDNQVVTEDITVATGTVSMNDTSLDGSETFTLLGTGKGSYGSVVMATDGSYVYTRNATIGIDSITSTVSDFFSYRVRDAAGNTSQATLYVKMNPVNDAPVLDSSKSLVLSDVAVAAFPVGVMGVLVSSLVAGVTDADGATATKGIAVTGVNSSGVFCYSLDGGTTWYSTYGVNESQAIRLMADADNRVYFKPTAGFSGVLTDALTIRAWDNADHLVDGSAGATFVNGGTSTYSLATDTVSVRVFPLATSFSYSANFDNAADPLGGASWVLGGNSSTYIANFDGVVDDSEFAFVNGKNSQDLVALKDQTLGKNQHLTAFTFNADLDIHSAGDDFFVNFCPATQNTVTAPAIGLRFQMTDSGSLTVSPSLNVYLDGMLLTGTLTTARNPLGPRSAEHLKITVATDGTVTMVENLQNGIDNTLVVKSAVFKNFWATQDMAGWTFEYGGRSGAATTGVGWVDDVQINATISSTQLPVTPTLISTDDVGTAVGVIAANATTNDTRPTFSGVADLGAIVKVYDGSLYLGSVTANSLTGAWSYTPVNMLSNGVHTINAKALDSLGNFSPLATHTFTVDSGLTAPVVLDLNHDGVLSYSRVALDVNNDMRLDLTAWAGPQDGVLVWDKYGDAQVHNSSQYAFTQYGGNTDLGGLAAAFDTNHDGVFDARDDKFAEFAVWQDSNQNGVSDAGELRHLSSLGICAISLVSDGLQRNPSAGVLEVGRSSATLTDGSVLQVADAVFAYQSATQPSASKDKLTLQDLLGASQGAKLAPNLDAETYSDSAAFHMQSLMDPLAVHTPM